MFNYLNIFSQSKRLIIDVIIAIALLAFYLTGAYTAFPGPVQLLTLKVVLVSMGFIHAHIVGKVAFSKVNWSADTMEARHILRIALYVVFIYAYSTGG